MAKNICPRCKEVIIGIETETNARCSKCETVFNPHEVMFNNVNTTGSGLDSPPPTEAKPGPGNDY